MSVPGVPRVAPKGSPRFGTLSHHSFFSRHNPHPNRVTHMCGLNGNPVCIVNDDWHVSTPLLPHPFIKSQLPWAAFESPANQLPFMNFSGSNAAHHNTETWREELKDLAAKVIISASANKDKKIAVDEPACRKTQYSAQTGRIIPPSSQASGRRSTQASLRHPRNRGPASPSALYDQELMVLELLCQILQTDSLSQVQQWLLFAGQRGKVFAGKGPNVACCSQPAVVGDSRSALSSLSFGAAIKPCAFPGWRLCVGHYAASSREALLCNIISARTEHGRSEKNGYGSYRSRDSSHEERRSYPAC
ncbi:hypothetical protein SKAU_G00145610 [Synaphobranchus kaupii]|uniref:Thymus, brain and testes associated n=1 Tax=Synaphobranchus kaupii TaxID=118154 RepID=A0A9Q1FU28_SYNKA|nr:hypothetical protein SKAU_G00145610 [Synaphobranchus kaupii]